MNEKPELNCQFCCCTSSDDNKINIVNDEWICDECIKNQVRSCDEAVDKRIM